MTTWAVAAVVTKRHGFGESNIEAQHAGNGNCDLCNFKRMGETSSLMVVWKDEYLGFACEASKG
jgi:hypothetical protein